MRVKKRAKARGIECRWKRHAAEEFGSTLCMTAAHSAAFNRLRKNPGEPQYLAVTVTLRTLLVVLKLPFSAAC
jgi:hypothetical protein